MEKNCTLNWTVASTCCDWTSVTHKQSATMKPNYGTYLIGTYDLLSCCPTPMDLQNWEYLCLFAGERKPNLPQDPHHPNAWILQINRNMWIWSRYLGLSLELLRISLHSTHLTFALYESFFWMPDFRRPRWTCDVGDVIMLWSIQSINAERNADTVLSILPGNIFLDYIGLYIILKLSCPWATACLLTVNICWHMIWILAYFTYWKNKPQHNYCRNGQIWISIRNVR